MSIFCSKVTKIVSMRAGDHTVTIRKLTSAMLKEAADAQQRASFAAFRAMGGAAFVKELRAVDDLPKAIQELDPVGGFDPGVLLGHAVLAWTYDEPVTKESLADLDEAAGALLAREILLLSKPSLFQGEAATAVVGTEVA